MSASWEKRTAFTSEVSHSVWAESGIAGSSRRWWESSDYLLAPRPVPMAAQHWRASSVGSISGQPLGQHPSRFQRPAPSEASLKRHRKTAGTLGEVLTPAAGACDSHCGCATAVSHGWSLTSSSLACLAGRDHPGAAKGRNTLAMSRHGLRFLTHRCRMHLLQQELSFHPCAFFSSGSLRLRWLGFLPAVCKVWLSLGQRRHDVL